MAVVDTLVPIPDEEQVILARLDQGPGRRNAWGRSPGFIDNHG